MILKALLFTSFLLTTQNAQTTAQSPPSSISMTLAAAENLLVQKKYNEATELILALLNAIELNDYGKIIAYWNLFLAYELTNKKESLKYANLFYETVKNGINHLDKGFYEKYNIYEKMNFAEIIINIEWMKTSSTFGKTKENPFPIRTVKFLSMVFDELCPDSVTKFLRKEIIDKTILKLVVLCECDEKECKKPVKKEYFFILVGQNVGS